MSLTVGKNVMYISVILCVIGLILVSGALFTEPYTIQKTIQVNKSTTYVDEAFMLQPNESRTFMHYHTLTKNSSIIQIDIRASGPSGYVLFKIIEEDKAKVMLESGAGVHEVGTVTFWTPPKRDMWDFVFENPTSTAINVSVTIKAHLLKALVRREETYYRPFLELNYGYTGIAAIAVATTLNLIPLIRESSEEYERQIERKTYQIPPR